MPSNTTENAVALACVVILNWLLTHLCTTWAMPPEVQSSLQALIVAGGGAWLKRRHNSRIASGAQPPDPPQKTPDNPAGAPMVLAVPPAQPIAPAPLAEGPKP